MQKELLKLTRNIGKLKEAGKITLDLRFELNERPNMTVDHQNIDRYISLAISGEIAHKNGRGWWGGGQINHTIREYGMREYANGYDRTKVDRILSIWDEWHLNDLNAGCVHQGRVSNDGNYEEWKKLAAVETAKCPHDYAYGSKWLVRLLPEEIMKEIIYLFGVTDDHYETCIKMIFESRHNLI